MPPEIRKLIDDMIAAADSIVEFVGDRPYTDFISDKVVRSAVYYEFVIIGEALSRLRQSHLETAQKISEHWRIIGFRNQIIHGYAKVDDEITWRIIEDKLPILGRNCAS